MAPLAPVDTESELNKEQDMDVSAKPGRFYRITFKLALSMFKGVVKCVKSSIISQAEMNS